MFIYFNGKFRKENKVSISSNDRGLLLGDGVFETILYKDNKLIFYDLHIIRLKKALKKIFINIKLNKINFKKDIVKLIRKNKLQKKKVVVRVTITRGISSRGIDINKKSVPTIIIKTSKLIENHKLKSVKLGVSKIRRNETSITSTFKSVNYLDNIIAKKISMNEGYDDVIFLNFKNNVCCCSTSNIFYLLKGKFYTPPLSDGVLNGIVREKLLAKKKVAVKSITLNNLLKCKEIFITNSILGIKHVNKVLDKKIGNTSNKTMKIKQSLIEMGM